MYQNLLKNINVPNKQYAIVSLDDLIKNNKENIDFIFKLLEDNEQDLDDCADWIVEKLNKINEAFKEQDNTLDGVMDWCTELDSKKADIDFVKTSFETQIKNNALQFNMLFNQIKNINDELTAKKKEIENLVNHVKSENKLLVSYIEEDIYTKELINLLIKKETIERQYHDNMNERISIKLEFLPWYKKLFKKYKEKAINETKEEVNQLWKSDLDEINKKLSEHTPENFKKVMKEKIEKTDSK